MVDYLIFSKKVVFGHFGPKLKPKLIMVLSQVTEAPTMKEARKTRNP